MTDHIAYLAADITVPRWHEWLLITIVGWSLLMHSLRAAAWALLKLAEWLDRLGAAQANRIMRLRGSAPPEEGML